MSSNRKVYLFKHINKKVDQKDIELGAAYEDKNLFKQGNKIIYLKKLYYHSLRVK